LMIVWPNISRTSNGKPDMTPHMIRKRQRYRLALKER
jgi:hypothetical protein